MKLRILDRYLVQGFLAPFGVTLSIFALLVVMGKFFEKMEVFNNFKARIPDIVIYLLLGLPPWLNMVLPIATMLALLFSLGALQQRGELTAARSAGIPTARLFAPYFVMGLGLGVISLIGGLSVFPKSNFESRSVYRVKIKKGEALTYRRDNVVAAGRNHQRFTIGWLDAENNLMKDVVVDRFDGSMNWLEAISASEAKYENGQWKFLKGSVRRHHPDDPSLLLEEHFAERAIDIAERPSDFALENKAADDMTGREILRRIRRLQGLGVATYKERVSFHLKLALPFANLVVILLAIPFAVRSSHQGRTQTFTYALLLAFLYWGMTSVFKSFAEHGHLAPWLAAWMSNLIFGGLAVWRLRGMV